MTTTKTKPVILTGDRPTGPLHLGHYVGSLKNRVELQDTHNQFVLIADCQALTDNAGNIQKVRDNVLEVLRDYLAVGIDPTKTTFCLQSQLPALAELSMLYLNFVTVSRLERNPTVRDEIKQRGFERNIPAGFLAYPVAQAADITAFRASLVPVGADQAPIIEQTNEIVSRVNREAGRQVLPAAAALIPSQGRLPGTDGRGKMSKSLGNGIALSASPEEIQRAVYSMYTDPNHLRVDDPGQVEGNVVFTYLDEFDAEKETVRDLKEHYRRGGLGDMVLKRRLNEILQEELRPIRERRALYEGSQGDLIKILKEGTEKAREISDQTARDVFDSLGMFGRLNQEGAFFELAG